MDGYGGFAWIPNPRCGQLEGPEPEPPRERVPPSEDEVLEAEDFLIGQLIGGPLDTRLVKQNRRRRKIRPSAFTVAKKRLGVETHTVLTRLQGGRKMPEVWEYRLPKQPTAAGIHALQRHRERGRWQSSQPLP